MLDKILVTNRVWNIWEANKLDDAYVIGAANDYIASDDTMAQEVEQLRTYIRLLLN